jgi:hypothetical protein
MSCLAGKPSLLYLTQQTSRVQFFEQETANKSNATLGDKNWSDLEDGRVEFDNNLVENAFRPTALGKKNWLFIGEAEPGIAAPSSTQ